MRTRIIILVVFALLVIVGGIFYVKNRPQRKELPESQPAESPAPFDTNDYLDEALQDLDAVSQF